MRETALTDIMCVTIHKLVTAVKPRQPGCRRVAGEGSWKYLRLAKGQGSVTLTKEEFLRRLNEPWRRSAT